MRSRSSKRFTNRAAGYRDRNNPWLIAAWASMVGLQVAAIYVPFLQGALHTVPLAPGDWLLMLAVAAPVFLVGEAYKVWRWKVIGD